MTSARATLFGFAAILMWSLLALLTVATGKVPPFQLAAMTFAVGGAIGLVWMAVTNAWGTLRQPLPVWALGVGGLFGYHALYFTALRLAPPAEQRDLRSLGGKQARGRGTNAGASSGDQRMASISPAHEVLSFSLLGRSQERWQGATRAACPGTGGHIARKGEPNS